MDGAGRPARRRERTLWRRVAVGCLVTAVVAVAGLTAALRLGPTRPARFAGKRAAGGFTYRVSYTYDDGHGGRPSVTDGVTFPFFLSVHYGTPLRVRSVDVGGLHFARLVGSGTRGDDLWAAGRWLAVVGVAVLPLTVTGRRRAGAASLPVATAD